MKLFQRVASTALAAVLVGGCGGVAEPGTEVGELGLTLLTTGDSGVEYRLRNALFLIRGPENVDVCSEDSLDESFIVVPLESGDYQVTLNGGSGGAGGDGGAGGMAGTVGSGGTGTDCEPWFLEYSANGRPFAPIEARLVSDNPADATIDTDQITLVTFVFEVDGRLINFGPGTLAINIDVTEVLICDESPPAPPALADACAAITPILENPASCDTSAVGAVDHQLTRIFAERDVDVGFDLDGVNTILDQGDLTNTSCTQSGLWNNPDGVDGVDNQLAALGFSLDRLDSALATALCDDPAGSFDLKLRLAVNPADQCANAQYVIDGALLAGSVSLNFDSGCLSGMLPLFPLGFAAVPPVEAWLTNVTFTASVDQAAGFDHAIIGGTASGENLVTIADIILPGAGQLVTGGGIDILGNLEISPATECDAVSVVLRAGGVADTGSGRGGGAGGAGGTGG